MNLHRSVTETADGNMTSKGQVLIPKHLRDRVGLTPGGEVTIGLNAAGQVVVLPRPGDETRDERKARYLAQIASVVGTLDTGFATTDEYMDYIRPHRREAW